MSGGSEPKCSFCGSNYKDVLKLIRGGDQIYICDTCVYDCLEIVEEIKQSIKDPADKAKKVAKVKLTPSQIVKHLNDYVIGQEHAKKLIAVAVYNHLKRINSKSAIEIGKSNIMLVGPTGSGKTYIAQTIAKLLDVPFAIADATSLTEAGYVGDDVDSILARLVQAADGDIKRAEKGVLFVDETDKIASRESRGRDVSGEGVQQALLKIIEGSIVSFSPSGKKSAQGPLEMIDTSNILFICGGAFSSLTDTSNNPVKRSLGLHSKDDEMKRKRLRHKDLIKFGMIPEFVGRLPVLAQLDPLSTEDMVKILTEPKDSLVKQYQALLRIDGVELEFEPAFLEAVAVRANSEGTGARGLRVIMEDALTQVMFDAPDMKEEKVQVTTAYLENRE